MYSVRLIGKLYFWILATALRSQSNSTWIMWSNTGLNWCFLSSTWRSIQRSNMSRLSNSSPILAVQTLARSKNWSLWQDSWTNIINQSSKFFAQFTLKQGSGSSSNKPLHSTLLWLTCPFNSLTCILFLLQCLISLNTKFRALISSIESISISIYLQIHR